MRGPQVSNGGKLKLIFHLKEPVVSEEGIDIIVIPGTSTDSSAKEQRRACSWLKPLVASTDNDTRVFYFVYKIDLDAPSPWKGLIDQGISLFHALRRLHEETQTQHRPVLFICHSLGGVVVKKSLCIAHQISDADVTLQDVTSGIIFLSSPHTTVIDDKKWENWRWIMKAQRRDISKFSLTQEDIKSLADLCLGFQDLHLQIPVLSVFETTKSRVRDGLLSSVRGGNNRHILVDETMCRTDLKYEQTFAIDSEHNDAWLVQPGSPFFLRLVKFMKSITEQAPANVALLFDKVMLNDTLSLRSTPVNLDPDNDVSTPQQSSQIGLMEDSPQSQDQAAMLETLADFGSPIRGGRLPVYLMSGHRQNPDFFGREAILSQIDSVFFPSRDCEAEPNNFTRSTARSLKSVVLCGMGGMGKTDIAIQYAFSRKLKFDAIFWVNADTTEKLNLGFAEAARALGLEDESTPKDDVTCREIVKRWLSKPLVASYQGNPKAEEEASWLLVLDNADNPDALLDFWPDTGAGCVIVTSRNPLSKDTIFSPTLGIDLSPFELDDAGTFLLSLSQREHEENSLELCTRIVGILGGLPLAIAQMGGIIRRRHLKLDEFLEIYTEDARRLHERGVPRSNQQYKHTISSVWMLEALSNPALAVLRVLSLLDPDRIQESILIKDTKGVKLDHYPKSRASYCDARTELIESSLVSWDMKNSELRIHRLVQDVVRDRLSDEEKSAVFEASITLLSNSWPFIKFDDRNLVGRLQKCEQLFPHLEKIRAIFEDDIKSGEFEASTATAALFNELSWYMIERAYDEKSGTYASIALSILDKVPEDQIHDDEDLNRLLSQSHQYMAVSCLYTDSPGALTHLKSMIALITERLEKYNRADDAVQLADAYNETAMAYMRDKTQEEAAVAAWMQSYESFGAIPGDPLDIKIRQEWPAIHLAIVFALKDEPHKAEELLLPILKAREEKFGKDSTSSMVSGKVLHALGDIRRAQGASNEAIDLFQRALAILRATIGDNHYITADACYCLAERLVTTRTEIEQEASLLLDQSLKVYGNIRWYRPQAARSSFMKGKLLKKMGNDIEGDAQLSHAMDLRRDIVPGDKRTADQLTYADFDKEVYYYSR